MIRFQSTNQQHEQTHGRMWLKERVGSEEMQRFHKHSRTCPSEDVGSQPCPSSTDEMRCVESFHRSVAFPRDICIQTGGPGTWENECEESKHQCREGRAKEMEQGKRCIVRPLSDQELDQAICVWVKASKTHMETSPASKPHNPMTSPNSESSHNKPQDE